MLKYRLFWVLFISTSTSAQELFVVTEPASNMPAKSIGIRMANYFMQIDSSLKTSYHAMPEIMIAPTKNIMLHAAIVSSNQKGGLHVEGLSLYAKYRFLSIDDVHKHFRMAAFGRWSTNNTPVHMDEISIQMHNSGYELGTVATGLLHKTAISSSLYYQKAKNNVQNKHHTDFRLNKSINYSLSFGQLVLPKTYTSYRQTNFNVMLEFIGQVNTGNNKGFLDVVPSIQAIFNSVARLDIGFRKQLTGNLQRDFSQGFIVKLEYLFFNALK
jgi:hypothetical protein